MCFFVLFIKTIHVLVVFSGCRNLVVLCRVKFSMLNILFGLGTCLTEKGGVTDLQAHAG